MYGERGKAGLKAVFRAIFGGVKRMSKPLFQIGREYMEEFTRIRERARKAEEEYAEILSLKTSSDYSKDRIQAGKVGDPTFASAARLLKMRHKFSRAEEAYEKAINDLDCLLKEVRPFVLRTIIVLHYIDGRSVAGIAAILYKKGGGQYTADTISNMKHQALSEIGRAIKERAPG